MKKIKRIIELVLAVIMIVSLISCRPSNGGDIKLYNVTFDSKGGSEIEKLINIKSGSTITKPTDNPFKDGYRFKGWYRDKEAESEPWNFASDTVTNDIILYANWAEEWLIDKNPEFLSEDIKSQLKLDYINYIYLTEGYWLIGTFADYVKLYGYYGTYNGYVAVRMWLGGISVGMTIVIDDVYFNYPTPGDIIRVWKSGHFYELKDIYEQGEMTRNELRSIAYYWEKAANAGDYGPV